MRTKMIVATDLNGGIGKGGAIPWGLPSDLRRFKALTSEGNSAIVMGRLTFESIGRPLPGRINIVLSRDVDFDAEGVIHRTSLEGAIRDAELNGVETLWIIGGRQLYVEGYELADEIWHTMIHARFDCDVSIPLPAVSEDWGIVGIEDFRSTEEEPLRHSVYHYVRR